MEDLLTYVEQYRKAHPDVDDLLKRFEIARETYERYLTLTAIPQLQTRPSSTEKVAYDANVSGISGQY